VDTGVVKLIELLLIVGAVFGFGFWQLASLRRDKGDSAQAQGRKGTKDAKEKKR
jgi:hypothetical protein